MSTGVKILFVLVCVFAVCGIVLLILPSQWRVEESVVIEAPPERIHPLVENLHRAAASADGFRSGGTRSGRAVDVAGWPPQEENA